MAAYGSDVDFYTFKADIVKLLERLGIKGLRISSKEDLEVFRR